MGEGYMLETSINTDYNNDLHDWASMEHQICCLAEAGFTHTQWIHDWSEEYMYSKSEMFQAGAVLKHYGVKGHSVHATEGGRRKDYTNANEYLRLAGVDLLKNRIDLCTHIGANVMVLHMQLPFQEFEKDESNIKDYYRQVYRSFDEIQSYAKAAGVKIALDNLLLTPMKYQIDKYERIFDRYDDDFIGLCYDSGHASIMSQDNYYIFLEKYYDRLYATHLQDTDSIVPEKLNDARAVVMADAHRVPFTGVLDWNEIARWVAKAPMDLPADFEVGLKYGEAFESHGEEIDLLKDCHERALRFHQMVLDARASEVV